MNQLIGSSVGKKCMMIVALAFSALAPPQSFAVAANADAIIEVERLHPYVENKRHRPKPASLEDHPCREWYAELLDATGDTFVELIRNGSLECIDDLEWISDAPVQIHVSREENIIAVARAIPEPVRAYDESTSIRYNNKIKRLLVFLRKAKDIHYWCLVRRSCKGSEWEDTEFYTIEPSSAAHIAVKSAIDAIIEHQFFSATMNLSLTFHGKPEQS